MIITQEPNQTQNQLRGYGCTRARVILLLHKDLDYTVVSADAAFVHLRIND